MPKMNRSRHNLSHYHLTTFDQGYLVPCAMVEVLMGDSFRHTTSALLRAATLVSPVMHPVDVRIHHWFVPFRTIWSGWDDFIRGATAGNLPTVTYTDGSSPYELLDRMGVPKATNTLNALPVRAYNMIYNEYYRDQDLITAVSLDDLNLKRISWEKDYFTSSRPYPQYGETAISIPFRQGAQAPVKGIGTADGTFGTANPTVRETGGGTPTYAAGKMINPAGAPTQVMIKGTAASNGYPEIYADLANATGAGIDINEYRLAMAMQRHLEVKNRFGNRIQDYLAYHGVRPRDGRGEVPEYLGGGKRVIAFSEVLATAEAGTQKVGDMAGHGIASIVTRPYNHFFAESGIMMSLMSVRPKTLYMNQLHKFWLRTNKDSFWQKEYELLGPQAVLKKEVYGAHANATDVFGYNGRHDEYRRHPSFVSGAFRNTTDDFWHMARKLTGSPTLNQSFVECNPTDRIYADNSEPELRAMVSHSIQAKRLVSRRPRY